MTEGEWLRCDDPGPMLEFLKGRASDRKLRLFAVACCRRILDAVISKHGRRASEVAEQYADAIVAERQMKDAHYVSSRCPYVAEAAAHAASAPLAQGAAAAAAYFAGLAVGDHNLQAAERAVQVALARDLFGSPWRPLGLEHAWLQWNGSAIPRLAQVIYEERSLPEGTLDRGRVAVLADMLEEAGCADAELLGHLRSAGPHVRGCFAVDLLLGKG